MEVRSSWAAFVFLSFVCLFGLVAATTKYVMEDECGIRVDMSSLSLQTVSFELTKFEEYYSNMDCLIRVTAPQGKQLMVKIVSIEVDCNGDYLRFYDGDIDGGLLTGSTDKICGKSDTLPIYASTGSNLVILFRSDDVNSRLNGFRLLVTAFRTDESCLSGEFRCSYKGRCISEDLKCDDDDNCGDNSDECNLSTPAIIGICVAIAVIIITIIIVAVVLRRRHVSKGKAKALLATDSGTTRSASGILTDEPSILKPDPVPMSSQPLFAIPRYPMFVPMLEPHHAYFVKSEGQQENGGPVFMTAPTHFTKMEDSVIRNKIVSHPPSFMMY